MPSSILNSVGTAPTQGHVTVIQCDLAPMPGRICRPSGSREEHALCSQIKKSINLQMHFHIDMAIQQKTDTSLS